MSAAPQESIAAIEPYRINVLVHNAQVLTIRPFAETAAGEFEQAWRILEFGSNLAAALETPAGPGLC